MNQEETWHEDYLVAKQDQEKWGFVNVYSEWVIPAQYEKVTNFKGGLAPVYDGNAWGCINNTGEIIIPLKYTWVDRCYEELVVVELFGKFGIMGKQGQEIVPCLYDKVVIPVTSTLLIVVLNNKWGMVDTEGRIIIPCLYDQLKESVAFEKFYIGHKNGVDLYIDSELNYYDTGSKERIKCEDCVCYNDYLTTRLCCLFNKPA